MKPSIGFTFISKRLTALILLVSTVGITIFSPSDTLADAGVALANPAAVYCIDQGGFYGQKSDENGSLGVCRMSDGTEQDAWDMLREAHEPNPKIANPAATFCSANGGTYNLEDGSCELANGEVVDGWEYLSASHAESTKMVNPAAAFCVESGGSYQIVTADDGSQKGICTLPDGESRDAWEYFREASK